VGIVFRIGFDTRLRFRTEQVGQSADDLLLARAENDFGPGPFEGGLLLDGDTANGRAIHDDVQAGQRLHAGEKGGDGVGVLVGQVEGHENEERIYRIINPTVSNAEYKELLNYFRDNIENIRSDEKDMAKLKSLGDRIGYLRDELIYQRLGALFVMYALTGDDKYIGDIGSCIKEKDIPIGEELFELIKNSENGSGYLLSEYIRLFSDMTSGNREEVASTEVTSELTGWDESN